MGRKTLASFNLQKYVEIHCNGLLRVHCKTRKQSELQHRLFLPDLIKFFGNDRKEIKMQTEKRNILNCKQYCTD